MSRGYLDNSLTYAEGGPYLVKQPTAQQAPVAVNSQFDDFRAREDTRERHRGGLEDFDSGAALFVAADDDSYAMSDFARRLSNLGQYVHPESESQPRVFSSLEVPYRFYWDQNSGINDNARRHAKTIQDIYDNVRFFGFADTEITLQGDHTRNSTGSRSIIARVSGDKTTCNTSFLPIGPAVEVPWFVPGDPALTHLNNGVMYPWPAVPALGARKWRAIFMPLTRLVFNADPQCVTRIVGKCLKPSQRNRALTLLTSSKPIFPPYAIGVNVFAAGIRYDVIYGSGGGGSGGGGGGGGGGGLTTNDRALIGAAAGTGAAAGLFGALRGIFGSRQQATNPQPSAPPLNNMNRFPNPQPSAPPQQPSANLYEPAEQSLNENQSLNPQSVDENQPQPQQGPQQQSLNPNQSLNPQFADEKQSQAQQGPQQQSLNPNQTFNAEEFKYANGFKQSVTQRLAQGLRHTKQAVANRIGEAAGSLKASAKDMMSGAPAAAAALATTAVMGKVVIPAIANATSQAMIGTGVNTNQVFESKYDGEEEDTSLEQAQQALDAAVEDDEDVMAIVDDDGGGLDPPPSAAMTGRRKKRKGHHGAR